ncbi:TPA: hypothetical protein ACH3X1_007970 [Trebouxia sp. C0004]
MEKDRDAPATTIAGQQTGPGQLSKSSSHSVGAWLTQSLAAIKRRGRSTDDMRMSMAAVGNVDVEEQHQLLVSSLVSQGLPPAGRSESLPVQAGADSAAQHAQHAQQVESASAGQQVKRKPGRPKKAGLGEPPYNPSIPPSSNGHRAPPSAAPVNTDAAVVGTHQVSASGSSPHAQLSPRRGIPEAELDAVDHPAGALLPQQAHHRGKGNTSVAIDLTKLLKCRTKHQVRDNNPPGSSGGGSGITPPSAELGPLTATLVPEANTAVAAQPYHASTAAEAAAEAPAAAAGSKGVEPVAESAGAQVQPTVQLQPTADESAATLSGLLSGKNRRHGRPPKQPVLGLQSMQSEEALNYVSAAPAAASASASAAAPATATDAINTEVSETVAAAADNRGKQTSVLPRSARKSAASSQPQDDDQAAHPAAAPAAAGLESAAEGADGFSEADQGQQGSDANGGREGRGRAGSHGPELPLSILLDGSSNKKRGRPYKNAANAEKAAERAARRAANEAAEKAVYEAAAEAAQVVITAPVMLPVKKRRGRPPKDPVKLAAALAAYHVSTTARQASMEAEEAFLNPGAHQEAAQAAAQAPFEEAQPQAAEQPQLEETAPPAPAITLKPVRKKRGRPPKAVAKAVVDNLNSPSDSLPIAALAGGYALRQDPTNSIEDEDHDQAILDAAAVLTSSLPYPQEIAVRPSPVARQGMRAKGKRRSSSTDAPKPSAARKRQRGGSHGGASQHWQFNRHRQLDRDGQMASTQEQERHRLPVREQQNPAEGQHDREGEQSKDKSRRRQLEVVSSRATAILESIGPDSQPLPGADMPNPDSHPVPDLPGGRGGYPSPGSDSEPAAPPQSGYPSKRQNRHKSNQPATAASASLEEEEEPVHYDSPEHQTQAMSGSRRHGTQAQTDASSARTQRTATASSPRVSGPILAAAAPAAAEVTSAAYTAPESIPDAIAAKPADARTTGPVSVLLAEHQAASDAPQHNSEAADLGENDLLEPSAALDMVSGGKHDQSAAKSQQPPTSSASAPAVAKIAAGSSVGHQQEAPAKNGSSDSEPALTQTIPRGTDRGQTEARTETPPRPSRLQEQLRDLRPTQPVQTQQAQHEAQHNAQQAAQPALQLPVLALLISGIPPIVLGTFQGDMQRASIILEAAGFLLPVDLSSSLLPPNLNSSPPLQHAAVPAVHALPAGLQTAQAAVQGGVYTSEEEEEEGLPAQHAADSGVEQAVTEGASLRGAHRRKQTRPGEQPAKGGRLHPPPVHQDAGRPAVRPGSKRGRPSNLARQAAAAAAAAAAAQLRDGDQASPSRSQSANPATDRDGLSQEEWERMGFHGELQGTGQNGLDQVGDAPDLPEAGLANKSGMMQRSRKPSARVLQAHDTPLKEQQVAFEGHSPEGRQGSGRGRLGKRGRGSLRHMGSPHAREGSQLPINQARFDHPQALPLTNASVDHGHPHIPRRKRSKPTELIRPLELLAAVRAAAGGRQDDHQDDHQDDYMPDNLSCLAAAAVAESESDAELARAPENRQQAAASGPQSGGSQVKQQHGTASQTGTTGTQTLNPKL